MVSNSERLYRAMLILVGPGRIQERLADAYREQIQYLDTGDLPDHLQYQLQTMQDELSKEEASGDIDEIGMSANGMTDEQAWEMTVQILDMYEAITGAGSFAAENTGRVQHWR